MWTMTLGWVAMVALFLKDVVGARVTYCTVYGKDPYIHKQGEFE